NISALVQVNENILENELKAKGILVQTKAGNIWSVSIPTHVLNDISNIKGIDYLETSLAAKPQMQDTDWIQTKTNLVHQGYNLPTAYKGNGVIVGIIDIGFDYNHPAFYNEQGNCRIVRVWEQNKTGTPPTGYNYGNELTNSTSIKAAITDRISDSHGTMVAGIAAGTRILSKGNANRGMAPNAELVLVGLYYGQETFLDDKNVSAPSFVDAINYIYKYAESVNKPAVINISWGHHGGPHDGTSLLDKAIENLTGAGKILVIAAGNEGKTQLHLQKKLESDTFYTYNYFNRKTLPYENNLTDFWGSPNSDFAVQIRLTDTLQNVVVASNYIYAASNQLTNGVLVNGKDSLTFSFACQAKNINNNKPNIFINYHNTNRAKYFVSYAFTSRNTDLHAWNCGYEWSKGYPLFLANIPGQPVKANYLSGDNKFTIGESGANSNASVAVGSYNSNVAWQNYWGNVKTVDDISQKDTITGFSSRGPTSDNRTKPDITGPGYFVGGPASSLTTFNDADITDTFMVNGKRFDYIMSAGTSFAAPCVAGAIALMLQADHRLTPSKVLNMLKNSARVDAKTGIIPTSGSNNWGWGKINTYEAVKLAFATAINEQNIVENKTIIYPNPFTNSIQLLNNQESLWVEVYNTSGQVLFSKKILTNESIPLAHLPTGIYLLKAINENGGIQVSKLVKY
ncbi:MAG: S8 family peptidase, partial [Bacteroidia bacterium]|nr:S8 family peptidase [Bacteroidia bacterium]